MLFFSVQLLGVALTIKYRVGDDSSNEGCLCIASQLSKNSYHRRKYQKRETIVTDEEEEYEGGVKRGRQAAAWGWEVSPIY